MELFNTLRNNKTLKKLRQQALAIDSLKEQMASLSDEQLKEKTHYFQKQFENVTDIKEKEKILNKVTNEAFAVCREAAKRVLNQFPYLVQVMGALVIHNGDITEMKTGEGKTLTATMAVYTNALTGNGVHVVTVNEYLASRDASWMGEIYRFLGLSVGCNLAQMPTDLKQQAYSCDITYTTNSELGFDYLRDNLVKNKNNKVQVNGLNFCVIDEADSILIDDAKTPLIISSGNYANLAFYSPCQSFASQLYNEIDYKIDKSEKTVYLTNNGIKKAEQFFNINNLYDIENQNLLHFINNALKANYIMRKNIEYIVKNNKVELVDQNTGRVMVGRSYSDGLHQAIEAKENVKINPETLTNATITYQNFFRLYNKLSGMTGTAKTEDIELLETYNMRVIQIPTNKKVVREDLQDIVYLTLQSKYDAIIDEVIKRHEKGQPVLVGTISVETSYLIYNKLLKKGIKAELLNAENDEREAEIISHAGQVNAVTIATNMAGRGTDIKVSNEALSLGGLCVIGCERHDSKRIDNQLRGRSGRQGDVGVSMFFVSLQDNLIKKDKYHKFPSSIRKKEKIENNNVNNTIDRIQKRVETINYFTRKSLLDYDNVVSLQRQTIYSLRDQILDSKDLFNILKKYVFTVIDNFVNNKLNFNSVDRFSKINEFLINELKLEMELDANKIELFSKKNELVEYLVNNINLLIDSKKNELGEDVAKSILNNILLSCIDRSWPTQLTILDHLKSGVFYRQYANSNPLTLYKTKSYDYFNKMFINIAKLSIISFLKIKVNVQEG